MLRIGFRILFIGMALGSSGCNSQADQNSAKSKSMAIPQSQLDRAQIARGRIVYEKNCQSCHGVEGKGKSADWRIRRPNGMYQPPPLDDSAHAWHHPTADLRQMIKQGSMPGVGDMPPWEGVLTEAEIDDVIVYIKSLWSTEMYGYWLEVERTYLEN